MSLIPQSIGSPDNGHKYLTDSNLDWGQGLKALARYLKEQRIEGIYFCYFGTGDPHYYGIRYRPVGFVDNMRGLVPGPREGDRLQFPSLSRRIFVISATNLQATYYVDKKAFAWLKELKPETMLSRSLLVYDLTAHPQALRKLLQLAGEAP